MNSDIQPNFWGSILIAYSTLVFLLYFFSSSALIQLKSLLAIVGQSGASSLRIT
jgi:hypothetical protein